MDQKIPANSTHQSDEQYWYLRAVQHALLCPGGIPASRCEVAPLTDTTNGEAIHLRELSFVPGTEFVLALSQDGLSVHLLKGDRLTQELKVDLCGKQARAICTNEESAFLAFEGGQVACVSIIEFLHARQEESLSPIAFETFLPQWTGVPHDFMIEDKRMIALVDKRDATAAHLFFFGESLSECCVVYRAPVGARTQAVEIRGSKSLVKNVRIADACVSSRSGLVHLVDVQGGRILQMDPTPARVRLKVVAGDGVVNTGRPQYGSAKGIRLGAVCSICEYGIAEDLASRVSQVATPRHAQEWTSLGWVPRSSKGKENANIVQSRLARALQENGRFFVVLNGSQGSAITVSDTSAKERGETHFDKTCNVWPLIPHDTTVAVSSDLIGEKTRVTLGPRSSLLFWRPGDTSIAVYAPDHDGLVSKALENKARETLEKTSRNKMWVDS